MPTLLAPADVRGHVETDLGDPALQRLLDDADAEIVKRYGPHAGNVSEVIDGREGLIFLSRPVAAIVSITETTGVTDRVLAVNDYRSWFGGRALERLDSGTNGAEEWAERVTVVYTPSSDQAQRIRVELDLVKLAIEYDAITAETTGDYSRTMPNYTEERDALLAQLQPALGVA